MASPVISDTIAAPGFNGLNSQDSSISLNEGFALEAYNCVIDRYGRIGARRGVSKLTTTNIGTGNVKSLGEFVNVDGSVTLFACANNKLYKMSGSTLTELTYGGGGTAPTITDDNWKQVSVGGHHSFFQAGHEPLLYDPALSTTTYRRISEHPSYTGSIDHYDDAILGYGRIWCGNHSTNKSLIQFSDLLSSVKWSGGSAGSLDVTTAWTNGVDTVVALAAFNGFLFIFGTNQILVYNNASTPASMVLQDTIKGVGCIARDSVQVTGDDIIFLSNVGLMSVQRLLLEKSAPMRDISKNIRDDLNTNVASENTSEIKSVYYPRDAFYLLVLPTTGYVYCFDMRAKLQDNTNRVTIWNQINPHSLLSLRDGRLLIGKEGYVGKYYGYTDNGTNYRMIYKTNYIDMGKPTNVKILKKLGVVVIGGINQTITAKWGFDYSDNMDATSVTLSGGRVYEYNLAEYTVGEFSSGIILDDVYINAGGAGEVIQLGFETELNGNPVSLQRIDVYCKLGKVNY